MSDNTGVSVNSFHLPFTMWGYVKMRAKELFKLLLDAGFTRKRVTSGGSHNVFRKDGRGVMPISVHGGDATEIRPDVVRSALRMLGMSDSEVKARFFGIGSPEAHATSTADDSGIAANNVISNATNHVSTKTTTHSPTKRSQSPTKRSHCRTFPPTLLATDSTEAYEEMRAKDRSEKEKRRRGILEKAEELMNDAPGRIQLGQSDVVSVEIAEFLSDKNKASQFLPEETMLEIAFIGVTAWVEGARKILDQTETEVAENQYDGSFDYTENNALFEYRDLGLFLRVMHRLEEQYWRHARAVREVRSNAVREVVEINLKIDNLRGSIVKSKTRGRCSEGMAWQQFINFDSFLATLVGEDDLLDDLCRESFGHEFELRVRRSLGLHAFFLWDGDYSEIGLPRLFTPTRAATILNQLSHQRWYADVKNCKQCHSAYLSLAVERECLEDRITKGRALDVAGWSSAVDRLVTEDPSGCVHSLLQSAEALLSLVRVKRNENLKRGDGTPLMDCLNCICCVLLGDRGVQQFLRLLIANLTSAKKISAELAANITSILVILGYVADYLQEYPQVLARNSCYTVNFFSLRSILRVGAMVVWRDNWEGSVDAGINYSDIISMSVPPQGFLQPIEPTPSAVRRVGRANPLVQNYLRLALLDSTGLTGWCPMKDDVQLVQNLTRGLLFDLFGRVAYVPEPVRKILEETRELVRDIRGKSIAGEISDAVALLAFKPLESDVARPAEEMRKLRNVIGKLEAGRTPKLLAEAKEDFEEVMNKSHIAVVAPAIVRLATIAEDLSASIGKILRENRRTKDFRAVFGGGVERFVGNRAASGGVSGSNE